MQLGSVRSGYVLLPFSHPVNRAKFPFAPVPEAHLCWQWHLCGEDIERRGTAAEAAPPFAGRAGYAALRDPGAAGGAGGGGGRTTSGVVRSARAKRWVRDSAGSG